MQKELRLGRTHSGGNGSSKDPAVREGGSNTIDPRSPHVLCERTTSDVTHKAPLHTCSRTDAWEMKNKTPTTRSSSPNREPFCTTSKKAERTIYTLSNDRQSKRDCKERNHADSIGVAHYCTVPMTRQCARKKKKQNVRMIGNPESDTELSRNQLPQVAETKENRTKDWQQRRHNARLHGLNVRPSPLHLTAQLSRTTQSMFQPRTTHTTHERRTSRRLGRLHG